VTTIPNHTIRVEPKTLLSNIRFYILLFSSLLLIGIYLWCKIVIPEGNLQIVKLTEYYALTTISFLYLSLLTTPLYVAFPKLPGRAQYTKARRALGVSAFFFALMHVYYAFFGQLGGFKGLGFLSTNYLIAISLSTVALIILGLLALTSFDYAVRVLGAKWKILHRFVYVAGFLILIHAMLLGTHFINLPSSSVARIWFVLLSVLGLLEALRLDSYLEKGLRTNVRFGVVFVIAISMVTIGLYNFEPPAPGGGGFNIHTEHLQVAKDAQLPSTQQYPNTAGYAGLRGDKTKRFTVSFNKPETIAPGQLVPLSFQVYDAANGYPVREYGKVYDKFIHMIVVNEQLNYFAHLHPDSNDQSQFVISTSFPADGIYHIYLNFQPYGAIEQQFAFAIKVGTPAPVIPSTIADDTTTKTVNGLSIRLLTNKPLRASDLSLGTETLTYTLTDSSGKPVKNLKPYLAAFGHLSMINVETYDFIHVHPNNQTVPGPNDSSGPDVQFLPLGLYGPIKPGTYKLFSEFNPDNHLITSEFTITIL
jgi:DMSO/TMAO reductase YedYZ heme-binding membrane subunit